jgi:hypothetical protein
MLLIVQQLLVWIFPERSEPPARVPNERDARAAISA